MAIVHFLQKFILPFSCMYDFPSWLHFPASLADEVILLNFCRESVSRSSVQHLPCLLKINFFPWTSCLFPYCKLKFRVYGNFHGGEESNSLGDQELLTWEKPGSLNTQWSKATPSIWKLPHHSCFPSDCWVNEKRLSQRHIWFSSL